MEIKLIAKVLSGLSVIQGCILLIPSLFAAFSALPSSNDFLLAALGGLLLGSAGWFWLREYQAELSHRTGFAVVTLSWLFAGFLGAFPYYTSGTLPSFVDAIFESFSGFSGTGATVLLDIEGTDKAVLLWRSMTQWLGGLGIVIFFLAILPILGVGGVQLFKAESTGPRKDKITPRVRDTARILWLLYVGLTILLSIILCFLGMNVFDAINHGMTTMATGGFSTKNMGISTFQSPAIDYTIALFMIIASVSFGLYYRLITRRDLSIINDTELKSYITILLVMTFLITIATWNNVYGNFWEALRYSSFTVIATASSTGFTNANYAQWSHFSQYLIILLMVMGGCSGSTAGGVKCIRLVAAFKLLRKELKQVVHPHAVISVTANDKIIRENVANAIWGFLFLYLFVFSVITAVLLFENVDMIPAATATFTVLSNIGPALGNLGPVENFSVLSDTAKIFLAAGMILGRLEFITVLVIFTPYYWRS